MEHAETPRGMFTPTEESTPRARRKLNFSDNNENASPTQDRSPYRTSDVYYLETPYRSTPNERQLFADMDSSLPTYTNLENSGVQRPVPRRSRWKFILLWILTALIIVCFGTAYHYYPHYLLICLTREFILSSAVTVGCLVVALLVLKCASSEVRNGYDKDTGILRPKTKDHGSSQQMTDVTEVPETSKMSASTQLQVKRTFRGDGSDIWCEFIRYYENIATLNNWSMDRTLRVFFTVLRGQAETYAYGLPDNVRNDWQLLKNDMDKRFGHTAMKDTYIAEAKLRRRKPNESFRDFGQVIQDLYRRAYPSNREYVEDSSLKTYLDNCSDSENFRIAIKRMRPKTLQEAISFSMQEECIRFSEKSLSQSNKVERNIHHNIYAVQSRQRQQENSPGSRNDIRNDNTGRK